ncbi:bifunctional DNA primase/polymerase [Nonomuraea diastatica]|uniref:Bifunctional DNA primase/polymerase n=1 Tax=Nonomuraea diastatica TaxID=1848329 RepID=A0A4R4WA14_9ACTN|nr:bifunctional DNA primase/polymerase [Nonomuraea diastatica]TDD13013.1 bifunctional DNA primase/polymerase [Nonomuraea diastatica]
MRRDDVTPYAPLEEAGPRRPLSSQPLDIARWCAAQGWPVHPLAPGRKTPARNCDACHVPEHRATGCRCLQQGRWCHGFHAATLDSERINTWWRTRPDFGVGVACGPAALVVIDIDAHTAPIPDRNRLLPGIAIAPRVDLTGLATGFDTLALLAALRSAPHPAADTATLRVRTPSGGLHVWYRPEPGHIFRCSTGSSSSRALAWQVDVRAHGGYIVAPGTRTKDGTYTVVGECHVPAQLPRWLAQELARTGHTSAPAPSSHQVASIPPRARRAVIEAGGRHSAAERLLHRLLADVEACSAFPQGAGFTAKLNRAAYTAGGLVAGGYLSMQDAQTNLANSAHHARPGQESRSNKIIATGLSRGASRPLYLQERR